MHDAPKQIAWSSRGDLAFGTGQTFSITPGYGEYTGQDTDKLQSEPRHDSSARLDRGRSKARKEPIGSVLGSSVLALSSTSTALAKPRTSYDRHGEHAKGEIIDDRNLDSGVDDHQIDDTGGVKELGRRGLRYTSDDRLRKLKTYVEEDISMLMRSRAIKGYGIGNVRLFRFLYCMIAYICCKF
jgi:WD repeat-containing protein mio